MTRKCEKCDKQPVFNVKGAKHGRFCSEHKEPGMVNVVCPTCEKCEKQPHFNVRGAKKGRFCSEHRAPGMTNVTHPTCEKCDKRPVFNVKGATKGRFCFEHKAPAMTDVTNPTCEKCDKRPSFNVKGAEKGRLCSEHKEPGMVNVVSPTCEKCEKRPHFNVKGATHGRFCSEHKAPGMTNVTNPTCEKCDKQPSFNVKGAKQGRFCSEHKEPDMINVKHPTCEKCDKRSQYGYPGKPPHLCADHRESGTIRDPRKRCIEPNCKELAIYGTKIHEHCQAHQLAYEINIVERVCESCGLLGCLDKNGKCETCDPDEFTRMRLRKQNDALSYLEYHGITFVSKDRQVDGGYCGKERPDGLIDCNTHYIVTEIDEYQHKDRPCECEQTRMVNISQSLGMPTLFIRYNPDGYAVKKGHKMEIKSNRLKTLLETVKFYSSERPKDFLQVMYLYFDGFKKDELTLQTILASESD